MGAVTDVQHVDGAGLDDEQDPVSAGAPPVDQLPDVLLELYALRGSHTPVRVSGQRANGIIDPVEPFDGSKRCAPLDPVVGGVDIVSR